MNGKKETQNLKELNNWSEVAGSHPERGHTTLWMATRQVCNGAKQYNGLLFVGFGRNTNQKRRETDHPPGENMVFGFIYYMSLTSKSGI